MNRLLTSIRKEVLLLVRDLGGLALIFIMPVILIFVMALIQDSTFRKLDETKLAVLFLDLDRDSVGLAIERGLKGSSLIELHSTYKGKHLDSNSLTRLVSEGKFQIGIIIPVGTSEKVRAKASYLVDLALEEEPPLKPKAIEERSAVQLYFDPAIKHSFRETTRQALSKLTYGIESKMLFDIFASEISALLDTDMNMAYEPEGIITLEERNALNRHTEIMPNSVQHNVPAWAVFAIFFILIPLSANIIKERNSGSMLRIRMMPGSYWVTIIAKILVYLVISVIQFALMLMVGIFLLPLFDLPVLDLGHHLPALLLMVIATGLAATGYGLALGAIAGTPEQAASFGSVSVIIMAAIGGIWVPVFMMPSLMQDFSVVSPLNWGLEGFYTIFLRNGTLLDILPQAGLLIILSGIFMVAAFYFLRLKKN